MFDWVLRFLNHKSIQLQKRKTVQKNCETVNEMKGHEEIRIASNSEI